MISTRITEEDIFRVAHEIPTAEGRAAYLHQACGDDPELRKRVLSLLEVVEQDRSFLEQPAPELAETFERSSPTENPGDAIGPYKLLEQIGEGGMGIVYVAEQMEPVRRRVALKIIKPGMDTKQVIARFEAERQALAMMDHPNIAKVLEAGATEQGRPYFVMELVRGMPITEYCDKVRLSPRLRLELFVDVCHAIQHAHQKGIIHRDLKPSNVLITLHDGQPVVKVIDFGVAKAVGQQLTERTVYTALTQLVGTPLYMSPEQAEMSGLDIDTRSDVFSLGVLLYELLTGQTPFDKETMSKVGFDEMRRMIRENEPPRPSRRLSTLGVQAISTASQHRSVDERRLSKILSGELDWIVMKALEKDRTRRYESASALAADIQRYLSDEPVLACPPTIMYRFQKFARKHKAAFTTSAAIAACLILGTTVSAWQAVRATKAEAQAVANEQKAVANEAEAKVAAAAEAQQRQRAEANEQKANTQRDEAQRQRDEVKALNDQLRRTLYASNMNLAHNAWVAGTVGRVEELLDQHRPKPGETDLRGFEWHYLNRLCHSELFTVNGHARGLPAPHSVAFSPDGKRLAIVSKDNTVKVCDAQTGQELLSFKGCGEAVAFSLDGKRLTSGTGDWDKTKEAFLAGEVRVWDAQTGQELHVLKGHTSVVNRVIYSPDGKRLASVSGDWRGEPKPSEVKIWDAQTGLVIHSLQGQMRDVYSLAFSPDGKRLASAGYSERKVKVWDAQTGQELLTLNNSGASVAFSPDGKRLASGRKVWDAETGRELNSVKGSSASGDTTGFGAFSVAFSPDGKRLVSNAVYGVKVRNAETGEELLTFKGHTGTVTSIVFSPDGTRIASGSNDGTVKVWEATTKQGARTFSGLSRSVSFSPDGKRLAFGTYGSRRGTKQGPEGEDVVIIDAQTGQQVLACKGHTEWINSVAYSPDGKRLASGSSDKTVKVWDAQKGRELLTFKGHTGKVVCVAFSPDGTRLASSISDPNGWGNDQGKPCEVKVWDATSGEELLALTGHKSFVNSVAYSPDSKHLATLSRDTTIKVWNAQTGQEILTLKVAVSDGGCVAFSPDGKRLASSDDLTQPYSARNSRVKVWDAQTGEELLTLNGHTAPVDSVVFSPDGKRLFTGAGGHPAGYGEIKVWDPLTGQELLTLDGRSGPCNDMALSPDGHRLVAQVKGGPGMIKIWDATPLPEKP